MVTVPFVWFLLVVFAVFLIGFLPGYLALLRFARHLKSEELLASSFGVSFGILAVSAFAGYLLKAWWLGPLLVLLSCALLLFGCKAGNKLVWPKLKIVLLLFFLLYFHVMLFQVATPYYDKVAYGDWWMHYELSRFYLGQSQQTTFFDGQATITSRTPLFNLVGSVFMSIFGGQFWVFQIGSSLMNSTFILSVWLLSRRLFPKASTAPVFVFGLFNTYLIRNATYTWPKLLAAYFVILALYYYLKQKDSGSGAALCGLFSGMAYMSHQYTIFFIAGLAADCFLFSGNRPKPMKTAAVFAAAFLLVLLPWHVWAVSSFGVSGTFFSSPTLLQQGPVSMEFLSKKLSQLYDFGSHPTLTWLIFRVSDVTFTLLPIQSAIDILNVGGSFFGVYYAVLSYYLGTLSGALTMALSLLLVFSLRKLSMDSSVLLMLGSGFIGAVLVQPFPIRSGLASTSMYPLVLVLLVLAAHAFRNMASRDLQVLALTVFLLEFFAVSWTQLYLAPSLPTDTGNYLLKTQQNAQMAWDYLDAGEVLPIIFVFILLTEFIFFRLAGNLPEPNGRPQKRF